MTGRLESGVTLIEVMITTALLTVALLGLALAFPPGDAAVSHGRILTRAVTLAEERLEIARAAAYGSLGTLAGTDATTYSPYTVATAVAVGAPAAGLTTVTVTVTAPRIPGASLQQTGPQSVVVESFFGAP